MLIFFYCEFFIFKQKTAYEMRISDWSSDVCSSDLDNQIEDTLNATCSRTYDARVLIESLCNGWQMSSKRIVLINGKLLAIGNPRAIREQLSQHPMSDFDLDAQTD